MLAEQTALNPLQISRLYCKTTPPTAKTRQKEENRKEENVLWPTGNQRQRLPYVNCDCTCAGSQSAFDDVDYSLVDNSDSQDDSDGITLHHVVRTLAACAQKGTRPGCQILRNMAAACPSNQIVTIQNVQQLYYYLENEDCIVQEGALLVIAKLMTNEKNATKFLQNNVLSTCMDILDDDDQRHIHQAALIVVEKLIKQNGLRNGWEELIKNKGIPLFIKRMSRGSELQVHLAAARVVCFLASLPDIANLVLDQGLRAIIDSMKYSDSYQAICCDILTNLVAQSERALKSVIHFGALPLAVQILREGPCGSQQRCILFLAKVADRDFGLQVIFIEKVVRLVMSALADSHCRKVRGAAASVLASMTSTTNNAIYRKVMTHIDRYFHEDESLGLLSNYMSNSTSIETTLNRITDMVLENICEQGCVERSDITGCVSVHLTPCINKQEDRIRSISDLVRVLTNTALTSHEKQKNRVTFSGSTSHPDKMTIDATSDTNALGAPACSLQTDRLQYIIDNGGLNVIDLLHVYSSKLLSSNYTGNAPVVTNLPNINREKTTRCTWTKDASHQTSGGIPCPSFHPIELDFIKRSLHLLFLFSLSTVNFSHVKMSNIIGTIKRHSCHSLGTEEQSLFTCSDDESEIDDLEILEETDDNSDGNDVTSRQRLDNFVGGEQRLARRMNRIKLFEAGIIDTVGGILLCSDKQIKTTALNILYCMVQPLEEPLIKTMYTSPLTNTAFGRPHSVLSNDVEKNKILESALGSMSSKMADVIRNALANPSDSYGQNHTQLLSNGSHVKRRPQSAHPFSSPGQVISATNKLNKPLTSIAFQETTETPNDVEQPGILPWKPNLVLGETVRQQCQNHLVSVCGKILLSGLLTGTNTCKETNIDFLTYIANSTEIGTLMKLSEFGCMQKLIDFLRIHDDKTNLEMKGLQLASTLMARDVRLKQLFNRHGGWQLLLAMSTYTTGDLRKQVTLALRQISTVAALPPNEKNDRRVHSAPPGGRRMHDIWDHIGNKWRAQDRATNVLRKPIVE